MSAQTLSGACSSHSSTLAERVGPRQTKGGYLTSSILVLPAPRCESSPMAAGSPGRCHRGCRHSRLSPRRSGPVFLFPIAAAALCGPLDPSGGPRQQQRFPLPNGSEVKGKLYLRLIPNSIVFIFSKWNRRRRRSG